MKVSCGDKIVKFVKMTLNTQENVQCLAIKECVTGTGKDDLYIAESILKNKKK